MKIIGRNLLLIPALCVLLCTCRRGDPSWETGLVFPIAHASMSIDNLVPDSLTSINSDGSVKLVYSTDFLGLNMDTLFDFPDTTITNSYNIPFGNPTFLPGQAVTPNTPNQTTFAVNSAQLVFGILESGILTMKMKNDIRRRIIVNYQIPNATLNGNPFDTSFTVQAAPDSIHANYLTVALDLSGYSIDFTGTNHDRVNTLTTLFTATIDPTETLPVIVYPADTVAVIATYAGVRPSYIRGYFGNQNIHIGPEESYFSVFHKVRSGSIGLDSLKMSLSIDNYVGMDARITMNSIWSRNSRTNNSVYLNHPIIGTTINVNRATYTYSDPPSAPSSYNYVFDNSNSNAKALLENLPDELGYDVTLITDPLGNVSGNNDFLYTQYGIKAKLDVEMPLNFFADQLVIADTSAVNFSSVKNKEKIEKGTLTLYAQNEFPFEAGMQIYLLDAFGNVNDSIVLAPGRINEAITGVQNNYTVAIGYSSSEIKIPISADQTQHLLNSTKVIFKTTFDTHTNPTYVKIFSSNHLDLQLSADFDYLIGK
ncbi:MAG: hypothetical protein HY064_04315 [Bacteroidetes bacterium]|nr:hypothetical protein [Bacteroidota bacterium]